MLRKLSAIALVLGTAAPALAWHLGGPLYSSRYPVPPSAYGYPLDDPNPSYYGGGRYREYYSYGRGYGLATFPGPLPNYPKQYWGYPPYGVSATSAHLAGELARRASPAAKSPAYLDVNVPADAEVWLQGAPTRQTGAQRHFVSPLLDVGDDYAYEVRARWQRHGEEVEEVRNIVVRAGGRFRVDFPVAATDEVLPLPKPLP